MTPRSRTAHARTLRDPSRTLALGGFPPVHVRTVEDKARIASFHVEYPRVRGTTPPPRHGAEP
jgi:hypothetical protein